MVLYFPTFLHFQVLGTIIDQERPVGTSSVIEVFTVSLPTKQIMIEVDRQLSTDMDIIVCKLSSKEVVRLSAAYGRTGILE